MHQPTTDPTPRLRGAAGTADAVAAVDDLPIAWQALAFDLLFAARPAGPRLADGAAADDVRVPHLARTA